MSSTRPFSLFLSYRRQDSGYAASLIRDHLLGALPSSEVFMDVEGIPFGVNFRAHLEGQLGTCDAVLVLIGNDWIDCLEADGSRRIDNPADFVRLEIETALRRGVPVIPVLVGQAKLPTPEELPDGLRPLAFMQAAEVRSGAALKAQLAVLHGGIKKLMTDAATAPVSRPSPESRDDAYRTLWQLLAPIQPKDGALTSEQRSDLDARFADWYFRQGGGMCISPSALEVLGRLRTILKSSVTNAELNEHLSRLRTALAVDLRKE